MELTLHENLTRGEREIGRKGIKAGEREEERKEKRRRKGRRFRAQSKKGKEWKKKIGGKKWREKKRNCKKPKITQLRAQDFFLCCDGGGGHPGRKGVYWLNYEESGENCEESEGFEWRAMDSKALEPSSFEATPSTSLDEEQAWEKT